MSQQVDMPFQIEHISTVEQTDTCPNCDGALMAHIAADGGYLLVAGLCFPCGAVVLIDEVQA